VKEELQADVDVVKSQRTGTINQWTLFFRGSSYMAPECWVRRVIGERESDGKYIETSMIVSIVGGVATTENGSRYTLGDPSPEWVEWIAETEGAEDDPMRGPIPGDWLDRVRDGARGEQ